MTTMIGQGARLSAPEWFPEWVGTVGGACWVSDPAGRIVYANDVAREWFADADAGTRAQARGGVADRAAARSVDGANARAADGANARAGDRDSARSVDGAHACARTHADSVVGDHTAIDSIGRPCSEVVRGVDDRGEPVCKTGCRTWCDAMSEQPIAPRVLRVGGQHGHGPWAMMFAVPLRAPDGTHPWIVHCACDVDRTHGMEEYLREVASRSARPSLASMRAHLARLTPREGEVLAGLAHDHDTHRIARDLYVSYATVRNHVRHILEKLEVHSIPEAVARYLLLRGSAG